MSQQITLSGEDLSNLATALEMLDEIEAKTGLCISPNMRLEIGIGANGPWVSVGRDENGKHMIHDRIGE